MVAVMVAVMVMMVKVRVGVRASGMLGMVAELVAVVPLHQIAVQLRQVAARLPAELAG